MTAIEAKPPAAAAAPPVSIVSSSSRPGSLKCTCMSMKPGATTFPFRSTTLSLSTGMFSATRAILPSFTKTSRTASSFATGSTTRPPLSSQFTDHSSGKQVQDRHAHRHPVGDLFQDHRIGTVCHFGGDLHAPVQGTGVHHDDVAVRQLDALLGEAVEIEVFSEGGERPSEHPLLLHAEHHHHINSFQTFVNVRPNLTPQRVWPRGHRRGRSAEASLG